MSNKLSGIIFLLFGLGLSYDSIQDLLDNTTSINYKALLLLVLAISSCIYGIKQIKKGNKPQSEH